MVRNLALGVSGLVLECENIYDLGPLKISKSMSSSIKCEQLTFSMKMKKYMKNAYYSAWHRLRLRN